MAIEGIIQPEYIQIDEQLRLRKYDGKHDFAFEWYQDIETVKLVDGVEEPYSQGKLNGMYTYLDQHGELYFIEALEGDTYVPIGDVTFWQEDMPIVIGDKKHRGKGIGAKVVRVLIQRGRELGYDTLYVGEIYHFNEGSRRCFEKCGFVAYEETEKGKKYKLTLI